MTTQKHTPGPWEARGLTVWEPGKTALSIATVTQHQKQAVANARLIAAAPELLEALAEVVRLHDKPLPIDQHRDPEKLWIIMQLMGDAARAAIAKATQP